MTDHDPSRFSARWQTWRDQVDLEEYEQRWDRQAQAGNAVHGEADLVMTYEPVRALDAGCGMGRVGIELAARGVDVVGVDLDPDLLDRAWARAPHLTWIEADLSDVELDTDFDLVVMAGNVLPFVRPELWSTVIENMARSVSPGGHLVIGAMLDDVSPTLVQQDGWASAAGLSVAERRAGWEDATLSSLEPDDLDGYAVTTYRRI